MFYTQHCNRRQTKESLCRVLFPSERNRSAKAVIYTEFDNSTNGWHGKRSRPYSWICFLREKKRFVKNYLKLSKIPFMIFLKRKAWFSLCPRSALHLYKFENDKNENAVSSVSIHPHLWSYQKLPWSYNADVTLLVNNLLLFVNL